VTRLVIETSLAPVIIQASSHDAVFDIHPKSGVGMAAADRFLPYSNTHPGHPGHRHHSPQELVLVGDAVIATQLMSIIY
jgi:hypothetical protein